MISNLISFFISRTLQPEPIYEALALQDGVFLPSAEESRGEFAGIRVSEVADREAELLPVASSMEEATAFLKKRACTSWPFGDDREVLGVVAIRQIETAPDEAKSLRDLAPSDGDFPYVHMDHAASQVLERMRGSAVDTMPVVSRADIHQLLGVVTLARILEAYGIKALGEKAGVS
jgi:CIC family chloride channel protein